MTQLFSNRASSTLLGAINASQTTIQLQPGEGALFPNPGSGEFFLASITSVDAEIEIVKCTARTDDVLTVERGAENQSGGSSGGQTYAFDPGDRIELRLTAGTLRRMVQTGGSKVDGDLDMQGLYKILQPAEITGTVKMNTIRGARLRAADNATVNEFFIPDGGGPPTIGGVPVLSAVLFSSAIFMFNRSPDNLPAGFVACMGQTLSDGTKVPDLRDKFIIGQGEKYTTVGESYGKEKPTTNSTGAHRHGGNTAEHTLSVSELPSHGHPYNQYIGTQNSAGSGRTGSILISGTTANAQVKQAYSGAPSNTEGRAIGGTGGGGGHLHAIGTGQTDAANGKHSHVVEGIHPSVALCFAMLDPTQFSVDE